MRRKRIENVVTRFLIDVGRIKANDLLTWQDVVDLVKQEPEHLDKKNIKFEDILPEFEYWTRDGKVARMIILKPTLDEHFDNIYHWEVHMAYDRFVDNWRVGSVFEFLDNDIYLIAWYMHCGGSGLCNIRPGNGLENFRKSGMHPKVQTIVNISRICT